MSHVVGTSKHKEARKDQDIGRDLDVSLVSMLTHIRGQDTVRKPRGDKVPAGCPIRSNSMKSDHDIRAITICVNFLADLT